MINVKNFIYSFRMFKQSCGFLSFIKIILELVSMTKVFLDIYFVSFIIEEITRIISDSTNIFSIISIKLIMLGLIMIVLTIISSISQIVDDICSEKMQRYLRLQTVKKVSELGIDNFDNPSFYDNINQSIINSRNMDNLVGDTVTLCVTFICTFILFLMSFIFNFYIATIIVILSIPVYIVEKKYYQIIYSWEEFELPVEREIGYITNILTNKNWAKELRFFNLNQEYMDRYTKKTKEYINEKTMILKKKGIPMSAISIVNSVIQIIIYIATGIIIINKYAGSIAMFYYYSALLIKLFSYTRQLFACGGRFHGYNERISKYKNFIFKNDSLVCINDGPIVIDKIDNIKFENVFFKYPGNNDYTLNNLSFEIGFNDKILLIGENGAGKSTIIKLLLKFYTVNKGKILINDYPIEQINTISLRNQIGVIFQDYCIFSDTYSYNISLMKEYDKEKLKKVTSQINLSNIVNEWPNSYDTSLTRFFDVDGKELSGGEKQKIAIGRCLYKKSSFLVMDEPNSSLDLKTENDIYNIVLNDNEKTLLLISHKLSKITNFDRILVLHSGCVEAIGTHEELYSNNKYYKELYNLQSQKYNQKGNKTNENNDGK